MPQQAFKAAEIKGLTPAIDLRRADGLFVLGGANYVFDSNGPKSAFGNRLLSTEQLTPEHVQGLRIKTRGGDRSFCFEANQITEWDELDESYTVIFNGFDIDHGTSTEHIDMDTSGLPHRWTSAYVNNHIFFCHPSLGILDMPVDTGICARAVGTGLPTQPIAICEDNGRLCVIDIDFLYWSAQGDGSDFRPRLSGPGFMRISQRVSGDPIMISSYGQGIMTWTTGGVLKSEFAGDAEVYRHRAINTELRPINSFCVIKMDDDTVMILDERGLFQSNGAKPEAATPLFNEYLIGYIQKFNLKEGQNIRLEWDELRKFIYISLSTSFNDAIYEKALVLYPALDKWGMFNESHYGILPVKIGAGQRADDYYGFVGTDQRIRIWVEAGSRHDSNGELLPLDASIRIGLIRFDELKDSLDQMTQIDQVMVGNVLTGEPNVLAEDFNLVPAGQDEDYNTTLGAEDLGFEPINYINHKLRILGTIDGTTVFDESYPQLTIFTKAARHYACQCVGIWHILELSATEVGEFFHCRAFELTASYAGKVS